MGDMIAGKGEFGLQGEDSKSRAQQLQRWLDDSFLKRIPRHFIAGGHELGYKRPFSSEEGAGLNDVAIEMFEEVFNSLFYTFDDDQYKFIAVSSDLELAETYDTKITDKIKQKSREQQDFYKDNISDAKKNGQKIILLLHDPEALRNIFKFMKTDYLDNLEKTFAGHNHATWSREIYPLLADLITGRLTKDTMRKVIEIGFPGDKTQGAIDFLKRAKGLRPIFRSMKLVTVPAPGGMLGVGGGFMVADLKENGIKVKKFSI